MIAKELLLTEHNQGGRLVFPLDEIDQNPALFGGKAVNLARLRRSGIPVPDGVCVTTEAFDTYLNSGRLPDGLLTYLEEVRAQLGGAVAVRSSATCEDMQTLSMAGVFQSHYVGPEDNMQDAIEAIYSQARSSQVTEFIQLHGLTPEQVKMALVVQKLIYPQRAGVIYTQVHQRDLLVQYVDGFGSKLVDGETHGSTLLLAPHGEILESSGFEARPLSSSSLVQLSQLSNQIEVLYDGCPQDIEFALTGTEVNILQARPLTADLGHIDVIETPDDCLQNTKLKLHQLAEQEKQELATHMAIFSDSNFSELLPHPTEMDFGVFAYIFTGSEGIPGAIQLGRKQMGYPLGTESIGLMSYLGGRPYFSIARDAATFYAGFPESIKEYFATLVNEYLQVINQDPTKGAYPEMGLYLQDPILEDLQLRYGERASDYFEIYKEFRAQMATSAKAYIGEFKSYKYHEMTDFIEQMKKVDLTTIPTEEIVTYCGNILEHLRNYSCVNFVKAARLGFYYSQRLQLFLRDTLGLDTREVDELFGKLSQGLDGSAITEINTTIAEASSEEEAVEIARQLVGHFSESEMLEIRHVRLKDNPQALRDYVKSIRQTHYKEDFEKQRGERLKIQEALLNSVGPFERAELEEIMQSVQTYMALRETIKYLFTQEYSVLRDGLQILGRRVGLDEGDIYFVFPRELPILVERPQGVKHLIRARKQSFSNYQKLDLPAVIRESDIDGISIKDDSGDHFDQLNGKFLAEGQPVTGIVVNLDQFTNLSQASQVIAKLQAERHPVILVAKQMNLGHDPFIALASGLILENAGIVSHGAQRARELGKGAIGGIKSSKLKTGTKILFDPMQRIIQKIE